MNGINEIKALGLAYGACERIADLSSIKDAINLLLTPQGREFAMATGFPKLDLWLRNEIEVRETGKVLLNAGLVVSSNPDVIVVGATTLKYLADSPKQLHHVLAMHGAKVIVDARNYAVVTVTSINSTLEISNDGTAIVSVERNERKGDSR